MLHATKHDSPMRINLRMVWMAAILLAALVLLSVSLATARVTAYAAADPDTINIVSEQGKFTTPAIVTRQVSAQAQPATQQQIAQAGFQISDSQGAWSTSTKVDLFKSEYTGPTGAVTVRSATGDKVVAPGTSNTYVFAVRNTTNQTMSYQMSIDATQGGSADVPLVVRLFDASGEAITGERHTTLAPGEAARYALHWEWPFEGDDIADTSVGQAALSQEVSYVVEINTVATAVDDSLSADASTSDAPNYPVKGVLNMAATGDSAGTIVAVLAIAAITSAIAALAARRRFEALKRTSGRRGASHRGPRNG